MTGKLFTTPINQFKHQRTSPLRCWMLGQHVKPCHRGFPKYFSRGTLQYSRSRGKPTHREIMCRSEDFRFILLQSRKLRVRNALLSYNIITSVPQKDGIPCLLFFRSE